MNLRSLGLEGAIAAMLLAVSVSPLATGWSNGGYSADPSHPDYGTHDWIAQHALAWLPMTEKAYIVDNLAAYLYGTELPDNGGAPDGIGDQTLHHVYYYSDGSLQDDASATRASEEYQSAKAYLEASDLYTAAKTAGILSHYVVDVAVFGHVMSSGTDWGAELHHSDYEDYVTAQMTTYTSSMFDPYLAFDGKLDTVTAYAATLHVAYDTTFGDGQGTQSCTWMDANYDWSNSGFKNSPGASLNRAVNALADVLHSLAVDAGTPQPPSDTLSPTVVITYPGDGATLIASTITVLGTASDNVAVRTVQVRLGTTTWVTCTGTTSWSVSLTLAEGPNTIYARANDTSGNVATASVSVTVRTPIAGPSSQGPDLVLVAVIGTAVAACAAVGVSSYLVRHRRLSRPRQ